MGAYDEDDPTFFEKYRLIIGGVIIVGIGVAVWFCQGAFEHASRASQEQRMVMVDLPPPAPPPPPPPSQAPPPPAENDDKMISQEPVDAMETKPDDSAKAAPADNSPGLGTSIQGEGGADGFGLHAGNGLGAGRGPTISHHNNSRWGWYANEVQSTISQALQSNDLARTATFRVVARVWADESGRITRARLARSTGNAALDGVLTNQILVGLILQDPPPDGMPMPIVLRLTARRSDVTATR